MKKIMASILATAMAIGSTVLATAAPVTEPSGALKNTVSGFDGGTKNKTQNLTQNGEEVAVPFNLGENETYYSLDFDFEGGERLMSASYSRSKDAIILHPNREAKPLAESREFEILIKVLNRSTEETVAAGYSITGEISYDNIQSVQTGWNYQNSRGVIYDFGSGAGDIEIALTDETSVKLLGDATGMQSFAVSAERNEALDYMFSRHNMSYLNFSGRPSFSGSAELTVQADEGQHVYSYANGRLKKLSTNYSDGAYTMSVTALETFIVTDYPLTEGVVNEAKHTVSPDKGQSNPNTGKPEAVKPEASKPEAVKPETSKPENSKPENSEPVDTDKTNPSTGAPELKA